MSAEPCAACDGSGVSESLLLDQPDMPDYDKWVPAVGQTVWNNFDSGMKMGVCIGYLNKPGAARHGQPVLEWQDDDERIGFLGRKKGSRFVAHPCFMWPFEPGSDEHKEAIAAGRFA